MEMVVLMALMGTAAVGMELWVAQALVKVFMVVQVADIEFMAQAVLMAFMGMAHPMVFGV